MAMIWMAAINEAYSKGFVSKSADVKGVDDSNGGNPVDCHLTHVKKLIVGTAVPLCFTIIAVSILIFYADETNER
jgi:hypothetical protein